MHIADLTRFLAELKENNNRPWFVMNKPRYDILREEFFALTQTVLNGVIQFDPAMRGCDPKKAMFRINRDIRFAKERHPYKTYFSASMNSGNIKRPHQGGGPNYYFHFDSQGKLLIGAGEYMPPLVRLKALRHHLVDDSEGFGKVLRKQAFKSRYGDLQDEGMLLRLPKGFDATSPYADYLRHKSLMAWTEQPANKVRHDQLVEEILLGFKSAWPLVEWLRKTPMPIEDE